MECAALCRYALLAGAAFCDGFVVGPLVDVAVGMNPAIVLTALLATASIFACFSGAGKTNCGRSSFQQSVKCSMHMKSNPLDMRHVCFDGIQAMHSYRFSSLPCTACLLELVHLQDAWHRRLVVAIST